MKIAIAQINPIVGDFEGNLKKHLQAIAEAKNLGARLIIFSELSMVGYIPRDILLEPRFLQHQNIYLHRLQEACDDIYVLVGALTKNPSGIEKPFFNSALCFHHKKQIFQYDKRLLPTYDVFDERRYFEPGTKSGFLTLEGLRIGLSICEDMWQHRNFSKTCYNQDPIDELKSESLDLLINMSGSPYDQNKMTVRKQIIHSLTQELKASMVYVNQVGGDDAIIFDGYSLFVTPEGKTLYAKGFETDVKVIDLNNPSINEPEPDCAQDLKAALCLGIKDYVHKNGFDHVIIGLSGGIDSALVLALCVEAIGSSKVKALYMPSRHSRSISLELATQVALNFKVSLDLIPIDRLMEAYIEALDKSLALSHGGTALENIQSRIRGNIIMAYANKHNALMMGCSNKSELAVGYGTLYGDIAGSLLPIGDLFKIDVYKLSRLIHKGRFPEELFTRAPSAELYSNQEDTDTLPPYEILDLILKLFIEKGKCKEEIIAVHPEFMPYIDKVLLLFKNSEFKRYQAPMILKTSRRNFGTGWDFPLTRK